MNITVTVEPCPQTPLNLRLGPLYAPRVSGGPFAAFQAVETAPNVFVIYGWRPDGTGVPVWDGEALWVCWVRFAEALRMETGPPGGISSRAAQH